MIKAEWKQLLTTRKMIVPMIAILFIPVLYAGMFLWAFWDPYANMDDLPVAVVNLDEGAEMDGVELQLGKELSDTLIEDQTFKFTDVSKKDADKGLENQDYYVVIEIPENFSQHATTLLDENPEKLTIVYKPNEGYNFLSAQIGETALDRIRTEVNDKVSSTYAENLFDSIAEMGDGFGDAADGAGKLHEGSGKLADGADELKGYLETLAGSTVTLADGTAELAMGAKKAAGGAQELNTGLGTLSEGSNKLLEGAKAASSGSGELKNGITQYTDGVSKLAESYAKIAEKENEFNGAVGTLSEKTKELNGAAGQLATGAANLNAGIQGAAAQLQPYLVALPPEQQEVVGAALNQLLQGSAELSTGLQGLSGGTAALAEGAAELQGASGQLAGAHGEALTGLNELNGSSSALREGANSLASGNSELATGLVEFSKGVADAQKGSADLATGLTSLTEGSDTLQEGTGTLATKSRELADGSNTLVDGTLELDDGVLTLQEKLAEASDTAKEVNPTEKTYDMAGAPVNVEQNGINHVPNYGTGFAPYFLSLGLFVGALLLSIVFPLVEPALKPTGAFAWFSSKVTVLGIVGLIQALISVAIVVFALGMEVVNMPLFILTAIITSYTFIALVQMFVSIFGDAGRFVAILILILQLTTSAGTFPLELIPKPLQIFNILLPMTYSVSAFKSAISTGDIAFLWTNNGILLGFMVVFLAITFGYFALIFKKRHSKETVEA
ncbi:YhgE/Pip family protein [Sporosarcina sp. G11-34]|uniref:YhgE/Pip family protein n=1 Tax=Sporosarcina sp. G11-34 TaxID=2849605 RepID=UPI0022A92536|nr:YhgE/Pip domain-containing protein [Sporosarcina sp. G11-34]MCZ2260318.1 YhgE/Pip domain-containing protein [Sporosarcina sp. G11-34]